MGNKIGCEKCDYTGFSYGKIPCVCTENQKEEAPIEVDTQYKPEANGTIAYNFDINHFKMIVED